MSANVRFFTPIAYEGPKTCMQALLETVDNYFYLGGKKAYVIQGKTKQGQEKALLSEANSSLLARCCKILSYFTIIFPLALFVTKTILRSTHTFRLIDPKAKLEKGIVIEEEIISKLKELMSEIWKNSNHEEIEWLNRGDRDSFKLKGSNLIFTKVTVLDNRFSNMIKAKEVCIANGLRQLIIPHAKKIEIEFNYGIYTFIVEEDLNVDSNENVQEELYARYFDSVELNEAARQLAVFIAKTGFNHVSWGNIPIFDKSPEFQGNRRVALINLKHMDDVMGGFTGDVTGNPGLIRCLCEKQIEIVFQEAKKQGIDVSDESFERAHKRRLKEIKSIEQLHQFYEDKGIITGAEKIDVDLNSLDLELDQEAEIEVMYDCEKISLKTVTEKVIAKINRSIAKSQENGLIRARRSVLIDTRKGSFKKYSRLGIPKDRYPIRKEDAKDLWLNQIIQALVNKGYIFKLDKINHFGYHIQA